MLLLAANVQSVDLDSFQDEFDLDQHIAERMQPRNNFDSVADAVRAKYPHVMLRVAHYAGGGSPALSPS